jgi:hypothetical protein
MNRFAPGDRLTLVDGAHTALADLVVERVTATRVFARFTPTGAYERSAARALFDELAEAVGGLALGAIDPLQRELRDSGLHLCRVGGTAVVASPLDGAQLVADTGFSFAIRGGPAAGD